MAKNSFPRRSRHRAYFRRFFERSISTFSYDQNPPGLQQSGYPRYDDRCQTFPGTIHNQIRGLPPDADGDLYMVISYYSASSPFSYDWPDFTPGGIPTGRIVSLPTHTPVNSVACPICDDRGVTQEQCQQLCPLYTHDNPGTPFTFVTGYPESTSFA